MRLAAGSAGELGSTPGSAALRRWPWTSPFFPLGLNFPTCSLMGFLLSTCCVLSTGVCVNRMDTVSALRN